LSTCLLSSVRSCVESAVPIDWDTFVFGSLGRCQGAPSSCPAWDVVSDVDLLVVYPDNETYEAIKVRQALRAAVARLGFFADIVLLSRGEQRVTSFGQAERAHALDQRCEDRSDIGRVIRSAVKRARVDRGLQGGDLAG
jgi:hypothetical protein